MFATYPVYTLAYKFYDPKPTDPTLPRPDSKGFVTVRVATPLHQGWNVILVKADSPGQARSLLVYGDDIPPTFTPAASTPATLNQADIDNGSSIVIQGTITDDSFGTRNFYQTFKFNNPTSTTPGPFTYTRDPVTGYITSATLSFTITDFAGNKWVVNIIFAVAQNATLIQDIGRTTQPTIKVSVTLAALLSTDGIKT
jgi:hypothetical protein